jgi:Fe-S-cluster containining protein
MWYEKGLQFECTRCGLCCTGRPGYVWVKIEDLHRIAEFLGLRVRDFTKQYVRQIGSQWSLIEKPNGDCIFYESGCKIYPVRPTQCRTFPFWKEVVATPNTWHQTAKECEGMNSGRNYSAEEIQKLLVEDK